MIRAKTFFLSAALIALGSTGIAQKSCFAREYSADHMGKNPNQVVKSIAIRFEGPANDKSSVGEWGDVTAYFNDTSTKFAQTLYCQVIDGKQWCGVECDGGGAEITWKDRDTILIKTKSFIMSGGCDGSETDMWFVKDLNAKFTTYRVNHTSMDACPPLDAQ